jgi:hypothetical protein
MVDRDTGSGRFHQGTLSGGMALLLMVQALLPLPLSAQSAPTNASLLPPPDDVPEEILRAEIYTEARSPVDGKLLTAAEYIELTEEIASLDNLPPQSFVSPQLRKLVELLRLRKLLRQFIPFIP